jgi:hypothetical protein
VVDVEIREDRRESDGQLVEVVRFPIDDEDIIL